MNHLKRAAPLVLAALMATVLSVNVRALAPKFIPSEVKMLKSNKVPVKESVVEVNGSKFHVVEYQGEIFYFKLMSDEKNLQDAGQFCKQYTVANFDKVPHVTLETKVTSIAQIFVEGLKTHCEHVESFSDINVGIALNDKKQPDKKKKVFYNPFENILGFKSDF